MPNPHPTEINIVRRGAVGVIRRQDRYLVIRRAEGIAAPGAFCFPGGGLEADETDEAALRREIFEELGVDVRPLRRVWHSVTTWGVELFWWEAELAEAALLVPNPAEVAEVHWLTAAEMIGLPQLLSSNLAFLDQVASGAVQWHPENLPSH